MKIQKQKIILVSLLSLPLISNGQFLLNPPFNNYIRTSNPATVQKVGIGNFPNNASVQAKLHVNSFLLAANPATNGFMFRTDGDQSVVNQWQLFTGTSATAQTQRFRLFVPANSNNVFLQSLGDLGFGTGATFTEHMRIHAANGNVSIGTTVVPNNIRILTQAQAIAQFGSVNPNLYDIIFEGRLSDDLQSNLRMMNGTNQNNEFLPQIAGFNNSTNTNNNGGTAQQHKHGLVLSGAINTLADVPSANNNLMPAIMEFDVRKRDNNGNNIASITQRNLFQWCNFNILEMLMNNNGQLGINTARPQNRLHITTRPTDPYHGSVNGSSGLRFENLTSANTPISNPGNGVLSVDQNGDVVYVDATNLGIGNYCSSAINPLTGDYRIPLNGNRYYFSDINANPFDNQVYIGNGCGVTFPIPAKLTVTQTNSSPVNISTSGIHVQNINQVSTVPVIFRGIHSRVFNTLISGIKYVRIGGEFFARNATFNIGVIGNSGNIVPNYTNAEHIGGLFYAVPNNTPGGNTAIGVAGFANGATNNIGVYGQCFDQNSGLGPNNFAGYFNGDLLYTAQFGASDAMFKTNINNINNALQIVNQLQPRTYNYDVSAFQGKMGFRPGLNYGFIAQEVEQILPELVGSANHPGIIDTLGNIIYNDFSYKTLNYQAFIGILTQAIKEQQKELTTKDSVINSLNDRLTALENCINNLGLCNSAMQQNNNSNTQNTIHFNNVTLQDAQSIVLDQNVPNPFAEQTTISYFLPDDVKKAQMLFYNIEGKLINSIELTQKGKGQLNVFANDLSNGIYTYTLVVDGQIVDTKRMVKNK